MEYNFNVIEKKWAKKWEESKAFRAKENVRGKKKYYILDMFPYPSGSGLHMGHAFTFSLGDIYARFKRLQGYNVLYPMGYDSFGLPAENAAIKKGEYPEAYTKKSITNFMNQQKAMGWSYDWDRMLKTSDPYFYKWDQWLFLQMLKKGIAYRKKSAVNYCSECQTVLANEQVVQGKCWRHEETDVEIRHLEQWFLKTTKYAEELLLGLDRVDWPQRAKIMQRNWIGKSNGVEIKFDIGGEKWKIFTTRPDTLYGVTFMVVSVQHPKLFDLVTEDKKKDVEKFLKKLKSVSEKELEGMAKEGVFTGAYAKNPANGESVPIYAGNFVLADYGSGMVMAVPAHDQRDYE
ncbi:MAG: class I tRNA ligase family protein, partial [Nanoarchaeota archaeon]|nr:class I tRNA ligase family protein [Nanoarchaeota archaeon]